MTFLATRVLTEAELATLMPDFPVFREDMGNTKTLEFTAITQHTPATDCTNAKFRVAIIQEHKEVASDVTYIKIT